MSGAALRHPLTARIHITLNFAKSERNCLAPPRAAARIPANWRSCEARRLLAYQYGGTAVSWMSGAAAARRGTRSGEAAVAAASRSGTPCRQTPGGSLLQGHAPEEA